MKLHDLTVTAFGPFAGTERVDFDALNDAGLFLLSGATGAGKTSILDAVCFALYGQVPGVRGIKALKSQHAPDELRPEVVLDFSVRERRFVVRRSPEWTRPKRRGEGTATEKARASLLELRDDGEHFLTARAAEVGLMVSELVGMQAAQFQQVAMLPQGEFQRFLQASSQDRHDVLQRLFHTDRFSRIEEWVQEHSKQRREAAESGRTTVQRLVDGIAERAGVDLPERLAPESLAAAAAAGEVATWVAGVVATATSEEAAARTVHAEAAASAAAARDALDDGRRQHAAWLRRLEAERRLAALDDEAEADELAESALDAHRRATACLPVLALLDRARREQEQLVAAAARADRLAADRGVLPSGTDADPWRAAVEAGRARVARAEALTPLLDDAARARAALASALASLAAADRARGEAVAGQAELPARLDLARTALDAARAEGARAEALALQLTSTRQRARAAGDLPAAEQRLVALQDQTRAARDAAADARDLVQQLQQRRLDGIAAELAGRLGEGEACLVCGSTDHPAPATPHGDAVSDAEQDAAHVAHDLAQQRHAALVGQAADAERQVLSLRELSAGRDPDAWAGELAALTTALGAAQAAAARVDGLETVLRTTEEHLAAATRRSGELDVQVAQLAADVEARRAHAARADADVVAAWGEGEVAASDVPHVVAEARADLAAAEAARTAAEHLAAHAARVDDLAAQGASTAADHGFDDLDDARAAALTEQRSRELERQLAERATARAAALAVLADDEVAAAVSAPTGTLAHLEAACVAADAEAGRTARLFHHTEQRSAALRSLTDRLEAALDAWAPARDDHVLAESMSRLVRGMGGDNQLQMRLSAYVLATRLDQVLDAANERLSHLRDQRYLLQRTGRATRRGSQAGLGLEVVDQWTGDVRDPATLSGGETFVVSLSLALGLADVVTHEAGGTQIDTLFVDEGFGTLDADTLDDVMDRLDGLRAGGRTVGVVSHVTELRSRIPTQVHVDKTPSGSSVRMRTLVG